MNFIEICDYYGWPIIAVQDIDDKVGKGLTIVIQKNSLNHSLVE